MEAQAFLDSGDTWTDERARHAMSVLLTIAKTGRKLTYTDLDQEIAHAFQVTPVPVSAGYGRVLYKVGESINLLSAEWQEEVPPLTILIVSKIKGQPSEGVDGFLGRYVRDSERASLSDNNRSTMAERATDAVTHYQRWEDVAAYFSVPTLDALADATPIALPAPITVRGGESSEHLRLKLYIAEHPELFAKYGSFSRGITEFMLLSGDEVDVLFHNHDHTLLVEVKTADAPAGELTRGIYQCVKYRAVLRAMYALNAELTHVQAVLATPQDLVESQIAAIKRLGIRYRKITR